MLEKKSHSSPANENQANFISRAQKTAFKTTLEIQFAYNGFLRYVHRKTLPPPTLFVYISQVIIVQLKINIHV